MSFEYFSVAEVHMNTARQTGVETAHCAHDVDAFKFVRAVFLEDGGVLNCVFVRPGSAVDVARIRVPRSRGVGVIVGDLTVANDDVVGKNAADGFVETAADG